MKQLLSLICCCFFIVGSAIDYLNIGLLSDIHLELEYDPNTGPETKCIKEKSGGQVSETLALYGRTGCETPYSLLISCLEEMKKKPFDIILVPGDIANHRYHINENDPYNETIYRSLKEVITNFTQTISSYFPNIPIVFTPGNNDFLYYSRLPNTEEKRDYDFLYNLWIKSIPSNQFIDTKENNDSFSDIGCYSVNISSNLQIISINNIHFYHKEDRIIQQKVLEWIEKELKKTKEANKRAILLYHVPHGYFIETNGMISYLEQNCYTRLAHILFDYNTTISLIISGHTHISHFTVFLNKEERGYSIENEILHKHSMNESRIGRGKFILPMYVMRGLSPQSGNFPGFGIVHYNTTDNFGDFYEEYTFLLDKSYNDSTTPPSNYWVKLFESRNDLKMKDLSADGFAGSIQRLVKDPLLLEKVYLTKFGKQLPENNSKLTRDVRLANLAKNICNIYFKGNNQTEICKQGMLGHFNRMTAINP